MTPTSIRFAIRAAGVLAVAFLAATLVLRVQARAEGESLAHEFRAAVGPLEPEAYASALVPDGDNAAIWLRAAAAALALDEQEKREIGEMSSAPASAWTDDQRTALGRIVSRKRPSLALIAEAAQRQRSSFLLSGADATSGSPRVPTLELIWLGRLLMVQARAAAAAGDWSAHHDAVAGLVRIATALEGESPLIGVLVGLAVERMAGDAVLAAVRAPSAGRPVLERLRRLVPDLDVRASLMRAFGCLGAGIDSRSPELLDIFGVPFASSASREEALGAVIASARRATRPLASDPDAVARFEQARAGVKDRPVPLDAHLGAMIARSQTVESQRRLARLAISLRIESLVSGGSYPADLSRWPEAAEPDPFTGGALRYERRADGSAVLAVPGVEELFNRVNEIPMTVPYTWELPPADR